MVGARRSILWGSGLAKPQSGTYIQRNMTPWLDSHSEEGDEPDGNEQSDSGSDDAPEPPISIKKTCPQFLLGLRTMVNVEDAAVVHWDDYRGVLVVSDPEKLASNILARYFKHERYASFQRQLHNFGFKKISGRKAPAPIMYVHPNLVGKSSKSLTSIKRKPCNKTLARMRARAAATAGTVARDTHPGLAAQGAGHLPPACQVPNRTTQAFAEDDRLHLTHHRGAAYGHGRGDDEADMQGEPILPAPHKLSAPPSTLLAPAAPCFGPFPGPVSGVPATGPGETMSVPVAGLPQAGSAPQYRRPGGERAVPALAARVPSPKHAHGLPHWRGKRELLPAEPGLELGGSGGGGAGMASSHCPWFPPPTTVPAEGSMEVAHMAVVPVEGRGGGDGGGGGGGGRRVRRGGGRSSGGGGDGKGGRVKRGGGAVDAMAPPPPAAATLATSGMLHMYHHFLQTYHKQFAAAAAADAAAAATHAAHAPSANCGGVGGGLAPMMPKCAADLELAGDLPTCFHPVQDSLLIWESLTEELVHPDRRLDLPHRPRTGGLF